MESGFKKLLCYKQAYESAMIIFNITKSFPKEEIYALTNQIRRSSRAICSNFAEAYRKRQYIKHFVSKLSDCDAECSETLVWLDFALDCNYISKETHKDLFVKYMNVGGLLGDMINNPTKYQRK
ncbi:MAG: four helix bundle protein [Bacteroidota bacterium]|nr:four helix bundle protein [Bacteroidota bacterium]